jgi:hypothetical protein
MTYQEMKTEYQKRYENEVYASDPETQALFSLFEKADKLTPAAQAEFVRGFDFEFALGGEMYLGGPKTAAYKYPHLIAEAPVVGIKIATR